MMFGKPNYQKALQKFLNYVKNWGIGGLIIGQYTLFDRLKLDVRYELTSQTNQLQLGLVFTYQKEYFWKR